MGNRISKVYTRTGDKGRTGIAGNTRLDKDDLLIQAIGEIDELNSEIGVIVAFSFDAEINTELRGIQHDLFNIGGMFAYPEFDGFMVSRVDDLEAYIDKYNGEIEPLKEFILPGGNKEAALALKTRAVCRRVERGLVTLMHFYAKNDVDFENASEIQIIGAIRYINRLSDLLFTMGRVLNSRSNTDEIMWASHRTT